MIKCGDATIMTFKEAEAQYEQRQKERIERLIKAVDEITDYCSSNSCDPSCFFWNNNYSSEKHCLLVDTPEEWDLDV